MPCFLPWSGGSHQWGSSGGLRQSSTGSVPPSDIPGGLNPPGFLGQGVKMPGVMAGMKSRSLRPRYRVLVVEDEPLTRFVTRAVLKVGPSAPSITLHALENRPG